MKKAGLHDLEFKDMPIIDVKAFLNCEKTPDGQIILTEAAKLECLKVCQCLHKFGILLLKDPRVNNKDNDDYLDMME